MTKTTHLSDEPLLLSRKVALMPSMELEMQFHLLMILQAILVHGLLVFIPRQVIPANLFLGI